MGGWITTARKLLRRGAAGETTAAIARVRSETMVAQEGLVSLYEQVRELELNGTPGAFVQCGVWHGGAAALLAIANLKHGKERRRIHLFDSFVGIPEPIVGVDGDRAIAEVATAKTDLGGEIRVAYDYADRGGPGSPTAVRELFVQIGYDAGCVEIHQGWFQDTVPAAAPGIGEIALLHLDGDWYESTKVCLDHLYAAVQPGGFVVIDDYGAYEGCRRAVDEFLERLPQRPELHQVNPDSHYLVAG